jgi:hypothetical protein
MRINHEQAAVDKLINLACLAPSRSEMEKKLFEDRLKLLTAERDRLRGEVTQLEANINAFNGAIEECNFWINYHMGFSTPT